MLDDRLRGTTRLPTLTPRSLDSVPDLLAQLEEVRVRGWAADDQETTIGVTCFAVAVGPPHTAPRFAISVTVLTSRLELDVQQTDLIRELRTVADGMASPLAPR